jgi:multimeric flavodoxin WrbA
MAIPKVSLNDVPIKILLINASPRGKSNSKYLIEAAKEGIATMENVEIEQFNFWGKKMAQCKGCVEYCHKNKECVIKDDFQQLTEMWLRADGIIWASPVHTFGPPALVRAWMERFGEIFMQNVRDKGYPFLRFAKPTGIMVQGSSRFGGQETTAQALQEHVIMEDCIPVSGDFPHSDQAVLGQVIDKQPASTNEELLHASFRMGIRVVEMTKLLKLGKLAIASSLPDEYWYSTTSIGEVERPVKEQLPEKEAAMMDLLNMDDIKLKIFAINASPRSPKRSNSQILLEAGKEGAEQIGGVEFLEYSFSGKHIEPCRMCIPYCGKHQECVHKDDMQEFRSKWLNSDGIIWSVPIYHMGPPSGVTAVIDRMNELRFQTRFKSGQTQYPRLMKAGGVIVQGGSQYGGQEITQQFFMHHFMLLQCLPVTADMPEAYLGVGAQVKSREDLLANENALEQGRSTGRRVTELAKIVKAGMLLAQDSLPLEYFPSQDQMGLSERRELTLD